MDLAALDFALDPALIAQRPLAARDGGRLLVLGRERGVLAHAAFRDLGVWLDDGDLLIANDAEVIPARLQARRESGAAIEVLLTEPVADDGTWACLARKSGRLRVGERLEFGAGFSGTWGGIADAPFGRVRLRADGDLMEALRRHGTLPLPPYIERPAGPLAEDAVRYQTVFARVPGAVAAPTAGLHFTAALLERLAAGGVRHATITLLVSAGTFLPIRSPNVEGHRVPPERYEIPARTADAIAATRARGGRVVAVGTTTVRALESATGAGGRVRPGPGRTALVIAPGYGFRVVDALVTNLHLPRSSLLALVAAFAGAATTRAAYATASRAGYRFYSYGDAMLIL